MKRVYVKPKDERVFLNSLAGTGIYVPVAGEEFSLSDRAVLCYWSASANEAIEIPCTVVARRLMGNTFVPTGVKLQVERSDKPQIRELLAGLGR